MSSAFAGDADRSGAAVDRDGARGCWLGWGEVGEVGAEGVVDLAGDVALETADDLFLVEAFGGAAFGVGAGAGAAAEPADGDQVERAVCFAVAAAIEPVSGGAAGRGGDRAGAAEASEGGLVAESFDVLAGADEELAAVLGGDAEQACCPWRGGGDEPGEVRVEQADLELELAGAFGDAAQRELGCLQRFVHPRRVGPQTQAETDFAASRLAYAELLAELAGGGHQQHGELVQGGGAGFDCALAGDTQLPDRFDDPARVLRDDGRLARERLARGRLSVDRVALPAPAASVRVRLIDLDNRYGVCGQEAHETSRVSAGRFDPDQPDLAEGLEPAQELAVAASGRREHRVAEQPPPFVERDRVMVVGVRVDATRNHASD